MSRENFQDLHLENPQEEQHIRLISEGGSSLIRSPKPVCIDSIQVSQTCTTESHHAGYRSATGACTMFSQSANALFSVPCEHAQELDEGLLPAVLRARFVQHGVALTDAAQVTIQMPGRIWYICQQNCRYSVRKLAAHLTVYRDTE
jgi:hypothetical protein